MTRSSLPVRAAPLTTAEAALVADLAGAAHTADGVAPLSEHALLHARHPGGPAGESGAARDLLIELRDRPGQELP